MPDIEVQELNQWAVYWPAPSYDNYGEPVVGDPDEIQVRWVGKLAGGQDPAGNKVGSTATVVLDRPILVGSLLWKGRMSDMPDLTFLPKSNVMVVVGYGETADIRGRALRRTVQVSRFASKLP